MNTPALIPFQGTVAASNKNGFRLDGSRTWLNVSDRGASAGNIPETSAVIAGEWDGVKWVYTWEYIYHPASDRSNVRPTLGDAIAGASAEKAQWQEQREALIGQADAKDRRISRLSLISSAANVLAARIAADPDKYKTAKGPQLADSAVKMAQEWEKYVYGGDE